MKILVLGVLGLLTNPSRADFTLCSDHDFTSQDECLHTPGCAWCPANAACLEEQFLRFRKQTGCPTLDDWVIASRINFSTINFFSDPLSDAQRWVYDALRVHQVWSQGLTGEGITVQVVDSGLDKDHAEFAGKLDLEASCSEFAPHKNSEGKPSSHGTKVASIAVGNANNGQCAAGIAPSATLSACLNRNPIVAFKKGLETTDVSINSWNMDACEKVEPTRRHLLRGLDEEEEACPLNDQTGIRPPRESKECRALLHEVCYSEFEKNAKVCEKYAHLFNECSFNELVPPELVILQRGITEGRNGKGIVYVFAAGNEYDKGETINMEGWLNTRYTITVGAVDQLGVHASYSTTGASALFISGPGGDDDFSSQLVAASPGGGCEDSGVGTSYATPAVGGAIALVLQANRNLGWRDVQAILAMTAKKTDPGSSSWSTNAAGYHHSPKYGFGLMDTYAAVEQAKTWVNLSPETSVSAESGEIDVTIGPDSDSPGSATMEVESPPGFVAESVVVYLQVDHASRGDLRILLESPQNTVSELLPGYRHENRQIAGDQTWELMTVRNWGEDPSGKWTITLVDTEDGHLADTRCSDHPFSTYYTPWEEYLDCDDLEHEEFCKEGVVLYPVANDNETGYSAEKACCSCGGGTAPHQGALLSWKIVAYGHMEPTEEPTQAYASEWEHYDVSLPVEILPFQAEEEGT